MNVSLIKLLHPCSPKDYFTSLSHEKEKKQQPALIQIPYISLPFALASLSKIMEIDKIRGKLTPTQKYRIGTDREVLQPYWIQWLLLQVSEVKTSVLLV